MIQRIALLAGALLMTAAPAMAQTSPAPSEPVGQVVASQVIAPQWETAPRLEYPQGAASRGVWGGTVMLRCQIGRDRRLHDCKAISERPADEGFAEAAMRGLEAGVISETWIKAHPGRETGILPVQFRLE